MPQFDPQDLSSRFRHSFRQINIPGPLDTAIAVVNPDGTTISGGGGGGTVTANQGTPAVTANAWPVKVTDGVNTAIVQNNQGDAIPNASIIGLQTTAAMYGFNGATWDRLRVDASKNLNVNIAASSVTQPISGTVTVIQPSGANLHVDVDNFPATQPVSGTVNVGNFPATTTVVQATGTNLHAVVDNFPATQPVSGTVSVSNFPATQPVSGTVTANQGTSPWVVSGTVTANAGTNLNTSALALESGGNLASITANTNRPTTSTSFQVSVTTSEAALATHTAKSIVLKTPKSNTDGVYIGTTGVTSSTGYLLEAGDAVGMDITNSNIIHAVANSGTQTLTVLVNN